MARIRTIKPEFWTSEQVVECSPTARLLFVGAWNFCDDYGIHPDSAKRLKMEIFPGDPFKLKDIEGWLNELDKAGLIHRYTVKGERFFVVTGWHHQKIEKPTRKFPSPELADPIADQSSNGSRPLADRSPPEGKGREGKGEERKGKDTICPETAEPVSGLELPLLIFPCDGEPPEWGLTADKVAQWSATYRTLDVLAECRKAYQWVLDNQSNRKTAGGMPRFLNGWLARTVNRRSSTPPAKPTRPIFDATAAFGADQ